MKSIIVITETDLRLIEFAIEATIEWTPDDEEADLLARLLRYLADLPASDRYCISPAVSTDPHVLQQDAGNSSLQPNKQIERSDAIADRQLTLVIGDAVEIIPQPPDRDRK